MSEKQQKLLEKMEEYKNDKETSATIREAVKQIQTNNVGLDQLKQQNKDIMQSIKDKGIDMPTFNFLLKESNKPEEFRDSEINLLEEATDAINKIFKK